MSIFRIPVGSPVTLLMDTAKAAREAAAEERSDAIQHLARAEKAVGRAAMWEREAADLEGAAGILNATDNAREPL